MTMADQTDIDGAGSQAPDGTDDDAGFRAALAERLGLNEEPEHRTEPAAPRETAPETPTAAEKAPEGDTPPSDAAIDYATLRAPELRQHLTAREQELQRVRDEHAKATERIKELETKDSTFSQREAEAIASLGGDDEYTALAKKYSAYKELGYEPADYMEPKDLQQYEVLTAQRKHASSLLIQADMKVLERNRAEALERAEKYGLDTKLISQQPATGVLIDHAVAVTEKRKDEEHKDALAEKDAEITSLRDRLAGKSKSPSAGGRAGAGDSSDSYRYTSTDSADDNILAGIRMRVDDNAKHGDARLSRR